MTANTGSDRLAAQILRKFIKDGGGWSCVLFEDGMALIDSSWVDMTEEEMAYLRALREELRGAS